MRRTLLALALVAACSGVRAQTNHPDSARVITSDIERFWLTYDRLGPDATEEDSLRAFFEGYYLPASPGLRDFIEHRMGSVYDLVDQINAHPRYYASIRESTLQAASFGDEIRATYRALDSLYDAAVFPDAYIQIGVMNSGGTYTEDRLLIGAEMYGRTAETPMDELGDWHRAVLKPVEEIPHVVAHELVHYQQHYPDSVRTLLSQSIREGAADVIAEIISGRHLNAHVHAWANPREPELWAEFRERMNGDDFTGWLYGGDREAGRPADLGYWMGYQVVRAYYDRAEDKRQAIQEILNIEDFGAFLDRSGYASRFGG
ncbi:MAG: hypothetical protein HKN04_09820 [Rhodothermaceae bacterium]|nr:hypothetical protein [Rhodothermaceae bacterium]